MQAKIQRIDPWSDEPQKILFATMSSSLQKKQKPIRRIKRYLSMEVHPIIKNNPERWSKDLPKMNIGFKTTYKQNLLKQTNILKSTSQMKYSASIKNNMMLPVVFRDLDIQRKIFRLKNNIKDTTFFPSTNTPIIRELISAKLA